MGPGFESLKAHHKEALIRREQHGWTGARNRNKLRRNLFVFRDERKLCVANRGSVIWPVGQAVKTAASHAANMGSIPVRVTILFLERKSRQKELSSEVFLPRE